MESLYRLEQAVKDSLKELKDLTGTTSRLESTNAGLEAKRDSLTKEIAELEKKKISVQEVVNSLELNAKKEIDIKKAELAVRESKAENDISNAKKELVLAESAKREAEESKRSFDAKYVEYEEKLKELADKKEQLQAVFK